MDPASMQQFLNGIPGAGPAAPAAPVMPPAPVYPPAPQAPQTGLFQQPAAPMFGPAAPAQPAAPYTGVPGMPMQPPTPPQPPAFDPNQPRTEYPLALPQLQPPANPASDQIAALQKQIEDLQQSMVQPPQQGQPWDETHRPKNWEEMYKWMSDAADQKANEKIQQMTAEQQQAQQQQQQLQATTEQQLNFMEAQLVQTGLLPQVANPNDRNDPGMAARRELYGYMLSMSGGDPQIQQLGPAAATLQALHDSGRYFDVEQKKIVQRNSQTPNAFAPIAGAGPGSGVAASNNGLSTRELSTMKVADIARLGAARLGLN